MHKVLSALLSLAAFSNSSLTAYSAKTVVPHPLEDTTHFICGLVDRTTDFREVLAAAMEEGRLYVYNQSVETLSESIPASVGKVSVMSNLYYDSNAYRLYSVLDDKERTVYGDAPISTPKAKSTLVLIPTAPWGGLVIDPKNVSKLFI